jgi:TolB-like protein
VLPFSDHSPGGDQQHFCQGINDEMIHTLAGIEGLRLVAWNRAADPDSAYQRLDAAERLNAAMSVSGSLRTSGGNARITTNLIDTQSGCYLWSGSIDRPMENVFAIQEEVAKAVAEQLKSELAGGAQAKRAKHPTANLAAYNLYVQGRYHLSQRTEEGLRKAVEFFEKAIVENAQYSQAYSGLALTGCLGTTASYRPPRCGPKPLQPRPGPCSRTRIRRKRILRWHT